MSEHWAEKLIARLSTVYRVKKACFFGFCGRSTRKLDPGRPKVEVRIPLQHLALTKKEIQRGRGLREENTVTTDGRCYSRAYAPWCRLR